MPAALLTSRPIDPLQAVLERDAPEILAQRRGEAAPRWVDPARYTRRERTKWVVLHYSATGNRGVTAAEVDQWHRTRERDPFMCIGYHLLVDRDGAWEVGRPLWAAGAGVEGNNSEAIHICYAGGALRDKAGQLIGAGRMTDAQDDILAELVRAVQLAYPDAAVIGHRDFASARTDCPGLDARAWATERGLRAALIDARRGERAPASDARTAYLQRLLAEAGHSPGPADGIEGPATRRAVLAYQEAGGLPRSGVLDTLTVKRLRADHERGRVVEERPADIPELSSTPEGIERGGMQSTTNIAAGMTGAAALIGQLGDLAPWLGAVVVFAAVLGVYWIWRERNRRAREAKLQFIGDAWSRMRADVTRALDPRPEIPA